MTTTPELTTERLDELEQDWRMWVKYDDPTAGLLGALGKRAPDVLTLIAMARTKQAAEQKRDELRALVVEWAADRLLPDGYCSECGETGPMINEMGHSGLCFVERALRILAQPTTEDGLNNSKIPSAMREVRDDAAQ